MTHYTYIYYDPSRGNEPIYVGMGQKKRAWDHLRSKRKSPFIQRLQSMNRKGIKPIIGVYVELDRELAFLLEEELISKFGRKDLGLGPLLNLTNGGEGTIGRVWTESQIKDWAIQRTGENNPMFGKVHSAESCLKIGSSQPKTRKYTPESKKAKGAGQSGSMNPAYLVGNKPRPITYRGVHYPSVAEASRRTGISASAIRSHLKKDPK